MNIFQKNADFIRFFLEKAFYFGFSLIKFMVPAKADSKVLKNTKREGIGLSLRKQKEKKGKRGMENVAGEHTESTTENIGGSN